MSEESTPPGDSTKSFAALRHPQYRIYFITTALEPEHRGEEEQMLRAYHDALVAAGVSDYSFEQLTEDTRLTKDLLAHRMIGSGDTIDTQVAGRDETFLDLMVRRVTGWVEA